ncbi:serine hydrolase domain-containing protein [Patulibacter brassicae]|uniref:Serine hydrolase domain-containing protein n=1 Tax=Patulibacter brassicae TaxID=1705717 RepID=A0ABU4VMB5_9ACTN|nr:serine hydrolase domain-containing protein [Patulibacter brassicae]MDX8152965.1 serine hydrolase domain-containing protein [Patulibacter brassicae]
MSFDPARLDAILQQAVDRSAVPGLSAVVVDRDGVRYAGHAGALRADGPAVDDRTLFRWASTTKALASVAALQLVEQGRLGLDDDAATHVPEIGALQVLEGFDGDEPRLRPPSRTPTVRELLTHTAGFGYHFLNADLLRYLELTGKPSVFTGQKAALTDVPMVRDPGQAWEYGTNTDWLGLVVEAVSGQTLGAYLAEHVLGPLGAEDVTFRPTGEQRSRTMPIHARTPDGGLLEIPLDLAPDPDWEAGGHGLVGPASAYARFLQSMLRDGELDGARLLRPETVALAFSDQLAGAPMPTDGIRSADPQFSNDVPPSPVPESWGLGFHLVHADVPGMRSSGTGDWAGLFNLYYWIDREAGLAGMVLTQLLPFFDAAVVETFQALEVESYAQARAAVA